MMKTMNEHTTIKLRRRLPTRRGNRQIDEIGGGGGWKTMTVMLGMGGLGGEEREAMRSGMKYRKVGWERRRRRDREEEWGEGGKGCGGRRRRRSDEEEEDNGGGRGLEEQGGDKKCCVGKEVDLHQPLR
jgi:hypothetical protein